MRNSFGERLQGAIESARAEGLLRGSDDWSSARGSAGSSSGLSPKTGSFSYSLGFPTFYQVHQNASSI